MSPEKEGVEKQLFEKSGAFLKILLNSHREFDAGTHQPVVDWSLAIAILRFSFAIFVPFRG
jgi:hypothetical protein